MRRWLRWAAVLFVACGGKTTPQKHDAKQFTLFLTTELQGTIEPCGCNSDPLGDLARTVELVETARGEKRAVLVIDGGSLLYSKKELAEHARAQEDLKASLIADAFERRLQVAAVGLGPYDLAKGAGDLALPRQAVNVPASANIPLAPPKVIDAGGVKVGVFGVVSPAAVASHGIQASDPIAAARDAVTALDGQGAEIVVALAHMVRPDAQELARKVPGIDFIVIGQNAPEPNRVLDAPVRIGDTYLVQPANRGQVITRLDVSYREPGPLADAIGETRAAAEIDKLDEAIPALEKELASWKKDPNAEAAFIAEKEKELAELTSRRTSLRASPIAIPPRGSWFTMAQIRIKKALACDPDLVSAKIAYDKAAGAANVAAAAGKLPPKPEAGRPHYVGADECAMCHGEAAEVWTKTKHHQAWETLEKVGKQFNFDCTYCHATGWDKPGGSNLASNETLRDVQCETCHGPGSIHVAADGKDSPRTVTRVPPRELCEGCHNAEHSDTFDYDAYLRDITGQGHGEAFRARLGEGPTGAQLRREALDRAGSEIGAGCPK